MSTLVKTQHTENTNAYEDGNDLSFYLEMLERLRMETFNLNTNHKLANHPYLVAAKEGRLSLAQRRAFVGEQYAIQYSDACSFARLAGHSDFQPESLSVAIVPSAKQQHEESIPDLFQFLLGGEVYASQLLLDNAKSVGYSTEENLKKYPVTAKGQSYPSFWARIALAGQKGPGAAACAVNFPAWGTMCAELSQALRSRPEYGYDSMDETMSSKALAFIDFFGTPIQNLDEMAATLMKQENVTYEDIVTQVRLLQEYEIMFWDACFEAC